MRFFVQLGESGICAAKHFMTLQLLDTEWYTYRLNSTTLVSLTSTFKNFATNSTNDFRTSSSLKLSIFIAASPESQPKKYFLATSSQIAARLILFGYYATVAFYDRFYDIKGFIDFCMNRVFYQ